MHKLNQTSVIGRSKTHESATGHVCGEALYIDDRKENIGQLHGAIGKSTMAHALIKSIDLSDVRSAEGVIAVITVDDVPGHIDIGPVFEGDPIFTKEKVEYLGQVMNLDGGWRMMETIKKVAQELESPFEGTITRTKAVDG